MKCVNCGTNHDYRARQGSGSCRSCGRAFAFEPKRDPLTDPKLLTIANRLSHDGQLHYTTKQLWYATARQVDRGGTLSIRRALRRMRGKPDFGPARTPKIAFLAFESLVQRWVGVHGPLPGHVTDASWRADPNRQVDGPSPADDLLGFGVERVVVTDNSRVAQMLVANRFHVEQRCAVFSVDGYPERIRNELWEMVAAAPDLTVLALHDATAERAGFARSIRLEWFPELASPVIDVALRPAQIRRGQVFLRSAPAADSFVALGQTGLELWEEQWLGAGGEAELESLGPSHLMTVLRRHIAEVAQRREQALTDPSRAGAWHDGGGGVVYFWHDDHDAGSSGGGFGDDGSGGDDFSDGFDGDG